ncbi:hypothetical protein BB559_007127, partial [Furculomyces boomerangus]
VAIKSIKTSRTQHDKTLETLYVQKYLDLVNVDKSLDHLIIWACCFILGYSTDVNGLKSSIQETADTLLEKVLEPKNIEDHEMPKFMHYSNKRFNLNLKTMTIIRTGPLLSLNSFGAPFGTIVELSLTPYTQNSDKVAIYARGEQEHKNITFKELYVLVAQTAYSLKKLAIIIFLATASIDVIWSCTSSEFGVTDVSNIFAQIIPQIYFSLDQSTYNAKTTNLIEKNLQILKVLPTVEKVIIIQTGNKSVDISKEIPESMSWNNFLGLSAGVTKLNYELLPFDHPIFIVFSSGTTGKPKCTAHCTGGENDVYFYYTTTGWIMWNSLPSAMMSGASIVTFEGNPLGPKIRVLWDMAEEVGVTKFGTSPRYLQTLEDNGYYPKDRHDLSKLDIITTTGSPLKSSKYDYYTTRSKNMYF